MSEINITESNNSLEVIKTVNTIEIKTPGPAGSNGLSGADGEGVPTGGTAGQVLAKSSNADYDTGWIPAPGGEVDSVNGQTGVVVLDADDIDDSLTTNKFVTNSDLTKLSNLSGVNTGDQDLSSLALKAITISTTSPLNGGGDLSANRTLSIPAATTSADGYLTSTDWNTFNGKQAALGFTPENVANKATNLVSPDNTKYPTTLATSTALTLKENAANKTTNFTANTGSNTLFATVKATFDAIIGYLSNYQPILGFNPANENLSNLTGTAVNNPINPDSDNAHNLGDSGLNWSVVNAYEIRFDNSRVMDNVNGLLYVDEKISIDFRNRTTRDSSEKISFDFQNRTANDSNEVISQDFQNRITRDSSGAKSVDGNIRAWYDDAEFLSGEWLDRRLFANDGSTVNLDWSNPDGPSTRTQSPNDNSTKVATTSYVDQASKTIIRVFSSTTIWNKPSNLIAVEIEACGGGGGGGGARRGAAAAIRCGGGSGTGGSIVRGFFQASDIPSSLTITVGAGGTSGLAATTDNANGGNAGAGGASSFGSLLSAVGGGGGGGGTVSSGGAGSQTYATATPDNFAQKLGIAASSTGLVGTTGTQSLDIGAPSGGSGGGITAGGTVSNGGNGGLRNASTYRNGYGATGGIGGTAGTPNGGNGSTSSATYFGLTVGAGGGGGASKVGAVGGNGGNGTGYGSGGGGGGASENGFSSGAGGTGGQGYVIIKEYY